MIIAELPRVNVYYIRCFHFDRVHTCHQHMELLPENHWVDLLVTPVWSLSSVVQLGDPHCSFHNSVPISDPYKPIETMSVKKRNLHNEMVTSYMPSSRNDQKRYQLIMKSVIYRNAWSKDIRNPCGSNFKSSCSAYFLSQVWIPVHLQLAWVAGAF